jgi:hypothetical protein
MARTYRRRTDDDIRDGRGNKKNKKDSKKVRKNSKSAFKHYDVEDIALWEQYMEEEFDT